MDAEAGQRLLLAEDCPDTLALILTFLESTGYDVTSVDDGEQCLAAVIAEWKQESPFDIVLMDLQLPHMNGYKIAEELRQQGYEGTLIAMTAGDLPLDEDEALEAGFSAYVSKVKGFKTIMEVLSKFSK